MTWQYGLAGIEDLVLVSMIVSCRHADNGRSLLLDADIDVETDCVTCR